MLGCCGSLQYKWLRDGGMRTTGVAVNFSWLFIGGLLGLWCCGRSWCEGLRGDELRIRAVAVDCSWLRCGGWLELGCCGSLQFKGLRGGGLRNSGVTVDCVVVVIWWIALHHIALWCLLLQYIYNRCRILLQLSCDLFTLSLLFKGTPYRIIIRYLSKIITKLW